MQSIYPDSFFTPSAQPLLLPAGTGGWSMASKRPYGDGFGGYGGGGGGSGDSLKRPRRTAAADPEVGGRSVSRAHAHVCVF